MFLSVLCYDSGFTSIEKVVCLTFLMTQCVTVCLDQNCIWEYYLCMLSSLYCHNISNVVLPSWLTMSARHHAVSNEADSFHHDVYQCKT